jgi:hypothetical protein
VAEIVPDEGLDYILAIFPKNGSNLATSFLGLFTSQTASTVPAASAVLATPTGVTEAAYTGYARQSIAAASWGTIGAKTMWTQSGRGTTAGQVSFPAATAAYATAINGFFLASASTAGIALFYSNFDDTTAVASLAIGDIIKVTPTFGLLN